MDNKTEKFKGNFYPDQYNKDSQLTINHNYLLEQFSDHDLILEKIKQVVMRGDYTLGSSVDNLEKEYASLVGTKHAIGVGSGTDALFLSLKVLGVDKGDEVITTPFTFFATIGAIVTSGATPVFVDCGDGKQVRSYTFVSDTARATIIAALTEATNNEVLNIGNGNFPISLKELAEKIIKIGGKEGVVEPIYNREFKNADRKREREIFERFCDSSKAEKILNWKPEVSLDDGIRKILDIGVIFDRWENLYDEQN